jgi:gamma-glutamyltranspeptidase / glutathione hydrolase
MTSTASLPDTNSRPARALPPLLLGAAMLALAGCGTARNLVGGAPAIPAGTPGFVQGFLGGVAAEEPQAASIARNVLSAGGNAADAAVAAGFAMSATLPSRVGLGGGGACLVFDARRNTTEAVLFLPGARTVPGGDRPAAVPMLARGLFALHTRISGGRPFEELIAPAEQLARFGTPMSRALHADLSAVRGPLFADADARATYGTADGGVVPVGGSFRNPALSSTLAQLRTSGVGDMYQGNLARRLEELSGAAGGGAFTLAELRPALPRLVDPVVMDGRGGDRIAFLPAEADGGQAATAQAFRSLASGQAPSPSAALLPASAGLMVYDRNGNAVSCAFTMNNLFGTGRTMPGTGFLLAAAPQAGRVPLLSAAIGWSPNIRAFRMAAAGSGQGAAPLAVAAPVHAVMMQGADPVAAIATVPEPGRVQLGACARYLPGLQGACTTLTDPRGAGVALGATDR